jgi:hypothetical protein
MPVPVRHASTTRRHPRAQVRPDRAEQHQEQQRRRFIARALLRGGHHTFCTAGGAYRCQRA